MVHHPLREQAVVICRHTCAAGVQLQGVGRGQGGEWQRGVTASVTHMNGSSWPSIRLYCCTLWHAPR